MQLTGKCKEEFEKWYLKYIKSNNEKLISNTDVNYFNLLTKSMRYGVLVEYFVSFGIYPLVIPTVNAYWTFKVIKTIPADLIQTPPFKNVDASDYATLLGAMTEAIEKADELRNKVLNR